MVEVVDELTPVPPAVRDDLAGRLGGPDGHDRAVAELPALHQVRRSGPAGGRLGDRVRIAAWNVERGRHVDELVGLLGAAGADVALLTELDVGMVRTGNADTVGAIAGGLGHAMAYGVEFVELGFGNAAETAAAEPGAVNESGFHGNAITAAAGLHDPTLIRIETDGHWFAPDSREPRVGGRMAVAAVVETALGPLVVASVHLESDSDPALRARQLGVVLRAIDDAYGRVPAVVGGDLNTFSASQDEAFSREGHPRLTAEDPDRWWWPVPHEPLFELAADHGFGVGANEACPTVRLAADQRAEGLPRLDWLLTRGVDVHDHTTIPAVADDGTVLTDHDAVVATVSVQSRA